jgi:hypothetical protein
VKSLPDYVERRIIVEYGRLYVYVYMTTGDGKLLPSREESFKQPYRLERKEAAEEANETWNLIYDHLNESINFPTEGIGDADGKPDE